MPGIGGNFYNNPLRNNSLPLSRNGANAVNAAAPPNSGANFYPTPQSTSYNVYQENPMNQASFPSQSPVSPSYNLKATPTVRNSSLPSVNQNPSSAQLLPQINLVC